MISSLVEKPKQLFMKDIRSQDKSLAAWLFTQVVEVVQAGINILKAHGKSARDSFLMNSFALNTGRAAQGMPLRVAPAKIACLDFNLQKTKMQLGVQVLVTDPRELEKIRQSICLEAFCDSDPSTVTSCKHEFHFQCILEWYYSLAFSVNCLVLYYSENYGYSFGISVLLYHFYALVNSSCCTIFML
ncbi:hypothetical protein Ahy_B08g092563 [Arachis hypogaea]|uniref:RING-type E3 ubiquitin transferase n=1 Tax=Arachis hypogaea TaxID=3818 RepID=A0A444Y421_ARAHY|nr:hypothetical protein Ahy_B08g092563 [Arachis hypogaea]